MMTDRHLPPKSTDIFDERIKDLRVFAEEDNEPFSEESLQHFLNFWIKCNATSKPGVFLLANGNIRVLWQKKPVGQLGIQFFPSGVIQYVILYPGRRTTMNENGTQSNLLQCMGTMDCEDYRHMRKLLQALKLEHVWF